MKDDLSKEQLAVLKALPTGEPDDPHSKGRCKCCDVPHTQCMWAIAIALTWGRPIRKDL